jgi:hypothetical protein
MRCAEKIDWKIADGRYFNDGDLCGDCYNPNICVICNVVMTKDDKTVECYDCDVKVHNKCGIKRIGTWL